MAAARGYASETDIESDADATQGVKTKHTPSAWSATLVNIFLDVAAKAVKSDIVDNAASDGKVSESVHEVIARAVLKQRPRPSHVAARGQFFQVPQGDDPDMLMLCDGKVTFGAAAERALCNAQLLCDLTNVDLQANASLDKQLRRLDVAAAKLSHRSGRNSVPAPVIQQATACLATVNSQFKFFLDEIRGTAVVHQKLQRAAHGNQHVDVQWRESFTLANMFATHPSWKDAGDVARTRIKQQFCVFLFALSCRVRECGRASAIAPEKQFFALTGQHLRGTASAAFLRAQTFLKDKWTRWQRDAQNAFTFLISESARARLDALTNDPAHEFVLSRNSLQVLIKKRLRGILEGLGTTVWPRTLYICATPGHRDRNAVAKTIATGVGDIEQFRGSSHACRDVFVRYLQRDARRVPAGLAKELDVLASDLSQPLVARLAPSLSSLRVSLDSAVRASQQHVLNDDDDDDDNDGGGDDVELGIFDDGDDGDGKTKDAFLLSYIDERVKKSAWLDFFLVARQLMAATNGLHGGGATSAAAEPRRESKTRQAVAEFIRSASEIQDDSADRDERVMQIMRPLFEWAEFGRELKQMLSVYGEQHDHYAVGRRDFFKGAYDAFDCAKMRCANAPRTIQGLYHLEKNDASVIAETVVSLDSKTELLPFAESVQGIVDALARKLRAFADAGAFLDELREVLSRHVLSVVRKSGANGLLFHGRTLATICFVADADTGSRERA